MPSWEITEPRRLEIDEDVTHLDVALFGGRLSVVGTDGPARVEVAASAGDGLVVTLASGRLAVFPGLSVEGRWGSAAHGVLGAGAGRLSANAMSGNTALLRRPVDPDFEAGQ